MIIHRTVEKTDAFCLCNLFQQPSYFMDVKKFLGLCPVMCGKIQGLSDLV